MKKVYIIRTILFIFITCVIFHYVSKVVTNPAGQSNYHRIAGFYVEEPGSLDAVYIGSSNAYTFWNAMKAWEKYGIAVYPYTCSYQPFYAAEYLIRETRKTQPDALYIVNINTIGDNSITVQKLHYLLDYMPFSLNKIKLTEHLTDIADFSISEKMEFYFPVIRYHTRWSELMPEDFEYEVDGIKGTAYHESYLKTSMDISDKYKLTDERAELSDDLIETLKSLLEYCNKENVNVLFVTVPRAEPENLKKFNTMNDIITESGYRILDLTDEIENIGLDLTKDYYDGHHTNIHGSIKFTDYLSEYLIDNYHFEDKRGNEKYSSWNDGLKKYNEIISLNMDTE